MRAAAAAPVEQGPPPCIPQPDLIGGCLARAARAWRNSSPWCRATVEHGLQLHWLRKPAEARQVTGDEASSPELELALREGEEKGLWRETHPEEKVFWVSRGFLVPKPGKVGRLVVDYSALNAHLSAPHFKMEGFREVRVLAQQGGYAAKIDLTSAYFQIPLAPESQKWLAFRASGRTWIPQGMPFGINLAPFTFTKIVKTVARRLREQAVRCVFYLDDILLLGASEQAVQGAVQQALDVLTEYGFVVSQKKSVLHPVQRIEFLGFVVDLQAWRIEVPHEKARKVRKNVESLLRAPQVPVRQAASVVGQLKAMAQAVPSIHLCLFETQRWIAEATQRGGWEAVASPPENARKELGAISRDIRKQASTSLEAVIDQEAIITTDASGTGWGAVLQIANRQSEARGDFPQEIREGHSTLREMKAVWLALQKFREQLRDRQVLVKSDCQTVVADLARKRVGSRNLLKTVRDICQLAEEERISLRTAYIPGKENFLADALSRTEDHHGLVLRQEKFLEIIKRMGRVDIDALATENNAKLKRFFALWPSPGVEGVDFFAQRPKRSDRLYLFPPPALVGRVLWHMAKHRLSGVIVIPEWPSQAWWPLLTDCVAGGRQLALGTDALVPTQAARELPERTTWWAMELGSSQ